MVFLACFLILHLSRCGPLIFGPVLRYRKQHKSAERSDFPRASVITTLHQNHKVAWGHCLAWSAQKTSQPTLQNFTQRQLYNLFMYLGYNRVFSKFHSHFLTHIEHETLLSQKLVNCITEEYQNIEKWKCLVQKITSLLCFLVVLLLF